jgi:phage/plasmid-like protein (TIGR03299 family)
MYHGMSLQNIVENFETNSSEKTSDLLFEQFEQIQSETSTGESESLELATPEVFGKITATTKIDEALEFGGIDYTVVKTPYVKTFINDEGQEEKFQTQFVDVSREDDPKNVFAMLRDTYQVVQNRQVLEYVEPLLQATEGQFTRVGSLMRGARMFAFITLNDKAVLPGGIEMNEDLFIMTSHDGSHCLSIAVTATLNDGTVVRKSRSFDLRHTLNVKIRMQEVVKIMKMKNEFFENLTCSIQNLTDRTMTSEEANVWLEKFLDFPEQKDVSVHHAKIAAKDGILEALNIVRTSLGDTRLAMALAVAYYSSHTAPAKSTKHFQSEAESRFRGVMIGTGAKELEEAWDELLKP